MRILLLLSALGSGGAERVMTLLANYWTEQGNEVTLMTTYGSYVKPAFELRSEVDLRGPSGDRDWKGGGRVSRLLALRRILRNGDYDGAIAFLTNVNVAAILARGGLRVPLIVSERTYPPAYRLSPSLELARRALYPLADTVVMQTKEGARWLAKEVPKARAKIIPNPVQGTLRECDRELPPYVPAGRRLLLAVGRLAPEKRFDLLIEAFAGLAAEAEGWHLVIAGEGPLRGALEARVRELNLSSRVSLPGQLNDIGRLLARAEAFALTSAFEGYPNALLEAVASGVPVAAIDCLTGVDELVEDGRNGVLASRNADAASFGFALRRVLNGTWPDATRHAAEIRERHSVPHIAAEWLQCFEDVAR